VSKRAAILFILRLSFYFSVLMLIFIHPGISVSFDRIGILQWFIIIPFEAFIAFLPEGKPFSGSRTNILHNRFLVAGFALILLSVMAGGFGVTALTPFFAGFISFLLTFLLFHYPRWAKPAVIEPFFMAWVCLRLLSLSRSGEDIAGQSMALTQFILVWTAAVFLFHSVVIYFCLYPNGSKGAGKEGTVFFFSSLAVLVMVLVVLPPDFVRNTVIKNLISERVPEKFKEESERGIPKEADGRREGRRTIPRDKNGNQPELRGISEYEWQNRGRNRDGKGGSKDNRQYMVMIVASDNEPVYMGDAFRGKLDPVEGFLVSQEEPINRIVNQRFFVTWFNNEPEFDIGRRKQEVFALSVTPQKYLPWRPISIDPTILSENSGPLRYIHQVVSDTHFDNPIKLVNTPSRNFSDLEKSSLGHYLELPLDKNDEKIFSRWLNSAFGNWRENREDIIKNDKYFWEIFSERAENFEPVNEYLEKIIAILFNFSEYQYDLNQGKDSSIAALKEFLLDTKEGNCVEFSNTLAILGRLAGIPSRVVTGYLVSESLQTNAHLKGIASLREKIPVLQQFPFNNLYMVTNIHAHSWTQFYIPDYGWIDFESTQFAMPPLGAGDFNTWDVVIPVLDQNKVFSNVRKFPWRAVLKAAGIMAVFALVCAYILRYGREAILFFYARKGGRKGARSLYLLLLARLAADGKPVKPASKTALEYAELFPAGTGAKENSHFREFATIYSELRWREFADNAEMEKRFLLLKDEYRNILKTTRRSGISKSVICILSLRGLAYL